MYNHDDLVFIVTAANIAGQLESARYIVLDSDEELTDFITAQYDLYTTAVECAYLDDTEYPIWSDWISDALVKEYGTEKEKANV